MTGIDGLVTKNCYCKRHTLNRASHILGDIERIVDRVAILGRGRLIVEGELDALKTNVRRMRLPGRVTQEVFQTLQTRQSENETELVVTDFSEDKLLQLCRTLKIEDVTQVEIEELNLEELFVETVK